MSKKLPREITKEGVDLFKKVVHMAIEMADEYKDERAYEAALVGMYVGLNVYSQKNRVDFELDIYVSWFVKTSIEYELGFKTEDTKIWGEKKK